jgi:hypothetical protein
LGFEYQDHPLYQVLDFAREKYPERLSMFSLEGLLLDTARQNDKRPAWVKMATVDNVVKNLVGNPKLRDVYILVRIPRDVVDRVGSKIVLLNEDP